MIQTVTPTPAVIAFSAIKGRTPRTLTATLLAEACARRARTLLIEGDPSAGLGAALDVPPGAPSYLQAGALAPAARARDTLRSLVVLQARPGVDVLLARTPAASNSADVTLNEWAALMQSARGLAEYDLVIVEMGSEVQRQPYLLMNVHAGDRLLLALAPDEKEVNRAIAALTWLGFAAGDQPSPLIAYLERHEDDHRDVERQQRIIRLRFPRALDAGTIPRAPRRVDDGRGHDASLRSLVPTSALATALHALAARLCDVIGIRMRQVS